MSDVNAATTGAPNDLELDPPAPPAAENTDQPTGTPADSISVEDEFPGDPMAAAMAAIFENRGIDPENALPNVEPEPDPTDPGPEGPRVENAPEVEPQSAPPAPPAPPAAQDPPASPPPATPPVVELPSVQFGGQTYTPEQIQHALSLQTWAAGLTPEQEVAINAYLNGDATFAPAATPPASGGAGSPAPAATPTAGAGTPSAPSAPPVDYDLDDPLQAQLAHLNSQIAALTEAQAQQQFAAQQAQQAEAARVHRERVVEAVTNVQANFAVTHQLSAEEVEALSNRAGDMGVIPALQQKHGGNMEATFNEALEMAMWSDPAYRERFLAANAQTQVDAASADARALDERRRKAASLSGGGAPPPRVAPSPRDMTPRQRQDAMVGEVAALLQNGHQP